MTFNKTLLTATMLTLGGFAAMSANAAPITSDQFDVLLKVDQTCTVVTGATADINLGTVAAGQAQLVGSEKTGTTTITTNCSVGSSAKITLQPVSTTSTNGTGNLKGSGDALGQNVAYKLTSVSSTGPAWGTTTPVTTAVADSYAVGIETIVYATVTDEADVIPGNYKDTVNVSVIF
nr:spore Coat Protein U domain, sigma-fimbriae tip adhesin [Psychrobacter sp.]